MSEEKMTFESAVEKLEKIIEKMENGEMTLDESVANFQKGIELSKFCSKKLDEVEKRITILLKSENGDMEEKDFQGGMEQEDGNDV